MPGAWPRNRLHHSWASAGSALDKCRAKLGCADMCAPVDCCRLLSPVLHRAPEQHVTDASGNAVPLTPAADMWSWACTVIHTAQGQPPFSGLNMFQIHNTVVRQKRGPAVPSSLPAKLRELLSDCLAADARARPTAMQALQVCFGTWRQAAGTCSWHRATKFVCLWEASGTARHCGGRTTELMDTVTPCD